MVWLQPTDSEKITPGEIFKWGYLPSTVYSRYLTASKKQRSRQVTPASIIGLRTISREIFQSLQDSSTNPIREREPISFE
jgi:hypothetical protein